eukprot:Rmarinus@m.17138
MIARTASERPGRRRKMILIRSPQQWLFCRRSPVRARPREEISQKVRQLPDSRKKLKEIEYKTLELIMRSPTKQIGKEASKRIMEYEEKLRRSLWSDPAECRIASEKKRRRKA